MKKLLFFTFTVMLMLAWAFNPAVAASKPNILVEKGCQTLNSE